MDKRNKKELRKAVRGLERQLCYRNGQVTRLNEERSRLMEGVSQLNASVEAVLIAVALGFGVVADVNGVTGHQIKLAPIEVDKLCAGWCAYTERTESGFRVTVLPRNQCNQ